MRTFIKVFLSIALIYSMECLAEFNINPEFNAEKCVHGHASRWMNACICNNPNKFLGKYCQETVVPSCASNKDCPQNSFCFLYQGKGGCLKNKLRNVLETSQTFYALSDSLLSYFNAESFCDSLGVGFRPISRQDLHCQSEGASCLDKELMLHLQSVFGNRGFFWLDEKNKSKNAYYADLNDGTVYNISKGNIKSCQVLCIKEKNQ